MKKSGKIILTFVIVCFICCIGCILLRSFPRNSGGKNIHLQSIESDGKILTIEPGEHWQGKMKVFIFSIRKTPQLAVWIENSQGEYVSTIFATGKSAKNNWQSAPREGRPETLPVWNHKRQNNSEQVDIVSSATPKGAVNIQMDNRSLTDGQEYNIYLEINHSFDYNVSWTENNSGVNGQPSLIYHAKLTAGSFQGTSEKINFIPIGHGSVNGSDGNIVYKFDSLTTALTIIKDAYIVK